ncbi:MAG TPA: serine/threonine-protein kinase, partial [Coriobacteriia bacterium]|nr:serine/threonine-protein kinase [Coriobacteriia bacterium]
MEQQLILDRYRPLEELGEGAFGSVVLAWDTRMQRRVAIKRLPLPLDSRGRPHQPPGLAEARTAAMLNHPNIVTVFDFDADADEAFLVMEHVDGASLGDLLDDVGGPLTVDEAATLLSDVSSAIEFAHENGVLHLDIKPENVLVTRDGRAKVADFGIAELSSLAGHEAAFGGTPGYMPLEQLAGEAVTERTDEWALAVLAYEALTAENPFAEDGVGASAARLEAFEPPL